ncbi:MAG TPA: hypothetical protein VF323_11420 [Candidatus Limnocylindrales bacterium]
MDQVFGTIGSVAHSIFTFFHDLVPGGFGLLLIPLIALGIVSLLVARR